MDTFNEQDYRDVIAAQQQTIDMQNRQLQRLQVCDKRSFYHQEDRLYNALSISEEDTIQLEKVLELWFFRDVPISVMIERFEKSHLPLRDKMFACFLIGQAFQQLRKGGK